MSSGIRHRRKRCWSDLREYLVTENYTQARREDEDHYDVFKPTAGIMRSATPRIHEYSLTTSRKESFPLFRLSKQFSTQDNTSNRPNPPLCGISIHLLLAHDDWYAALDEELPLLTGGEDRARVTVGVVLDALRKPMDYLGYPMPPDPRPADRLADPPRKTIGEQYAAEGYVRGSSELEGFH